MLDNRELRQIAHNYLDRRLQEDTAGSAEALVAPLLAIAEALQDIATHDAG